ncbi:hypothetical protein [Acerihabitans sp.]|uniref:hypothetical protein n=1 Tax=Acerihabitans sp. TaxID=2811394 RepID=UPI002ED9DC69
MSLKADHLRDGCQSLVRELTRLSQLRKPLSIDEFYEYTANELFLKKIFELYGGDIISLGILDHKNIVHDQELINYIENAFSRHSNAVSPEDYGVNDNAYLLAINIAVAILREADEF